jgi:hypothetical protein
VSGSRCMSRAQHSTASDARDPYKTSPPRLAAGPAAILLTGGLARQSPSAQGLGGFSGEETARSAGGTSRSNRDDPRAESAEGSAGTRLAFGPRERCPCASSNPHCSSSASSSAKSPLDLLRALDATPNGYRLVVEGGWFRRTLGHQKKRQELDQELGIRNWESGTGNQELGPRTG